MALDTIRRVSVWFSTDRRLRLLFTQTMWSRLMREPTIHGRIDGWRLRYGLEDHLPSYRLKNGDSRSSPSRSGSPSPAGEIVRAVRSRHRQRSHFDAGPSYSAGSPYTSSGPDIGKDRPRNQLLKRFPPLSRRFGGRTRARTSDPLIKRLRRVESNQWLAGLRLELIRPKMGVCRAFTTLLLPGRPGSCCTATWLQISSCACLPISTGYCGWPHSGQREEPSSSCDKPHRRRTR